MNNAAQLNKFFFKRSNTDGPWSFFCISIFCLYLKLQYCKLYRVIHFVVSKVNVNKTNKIFFFVSWYFHAKCCKHWFFWGNFWPLFDTYWAVSQPITLSDQRAHQTLTFSGCNGSSDPQIRQICLLTNPPNVKSASLLKKNFFWKIAVHGMVLSKLTLKISIFFCLNKTLESQWPFGNIGDIAHLLDYMQTLVQIFLFRTVVDWKLE